MSHLQGVDHIKWFTPRSVVARKYHSIFQELIMGCAALHRYAPLLIHLITNLNMTSWIACECLPSGFNST